jgi:hypothetical protein
MYKPPSLDVLTQDMKNCEQTPGQSIWEHGNSVFSFFIDWNDGDYQKPWKLPDWESQILKLNGRK